MTSISHQTHLLLAPPALLRSYIIDLQRCDRNNLRHAAAVDSDSSRPDSWKHLLHSEPNIPSTAAAAAVVWKPSVSLAWRTSTQFQESVFVFAKWLIRLCPKVGGWGYLVSIAAWEAQLELQADSSNFKNLCGVSWLLMKELPGELQSFVTLASHKVVEKWNMATERGEKVMFVIWNSNRIR